jgi:exosortase A-associated hydrolase 1
MDIHMRRTLTFPCGEAMLAATLDEGDAATGLLIVSGGNEIRSGAHRGMAMLAARIAAAGHPVLRFDRRGIGDSDGDNGGFLSSRDDIASALSAMRSACPALTRIVGFGNCDAASALVLHQPLMLDAVVLANPWTIEDSGEASGVTADPEGEDRGSSTLPPAAAIRARYLARLRDPASLIRLLRGDVDLRKLLRGVTRMLRRQPAATEHSLGGRVVGGIGALALPSHILLAIGDRTAQAFAEHWDAAPPLQRAQARLSKRASASHSFAGEDAIWLEEILLAELRR